MFVVFRGQIPACSEFFSSPLSLFFSPNEKIHFDLNTQRGHVFSFQRSSSRTGHVVEEEEKVTFDCRRDIFN